MFLCAFSMFLASKSSRVCCYDDMFHPGVQGRTTAKTGTSVSIHFYIGYACLRSTLCTRFNRCQSIHVFGNLCHWNHIKSTYLNTRTIHCIDTGSTFKESMPP
ncbi:hypothetical protein F5X97DRAFT_215946 [Nemania serpens]|nr:hypothetical protein F5X97DRAFT_215946 [Nemania serpens]